MDGEHFLQVVQMSNIVYREGTEDDLDRLLEMASSFWDTVGYEEEFCNESCLEMLKLCMEHELIAVVQVDNLVEGFAAGLKSPLIANQKVSQGTELAWWITPQARKKGLGVSLLTQLESQAKKQGIKYWSMVFMSNSMPEVVEDIYKNLGYKKTETTYTKVL